MQAGCLGTRLQSYVKFTKRKRKVKINGNLEDSLGLAHSKPGRNARKANLLLYPQCQEYAILWLDHCTAWCVSTAKKLPATQMHADKLEVYSFGCFFWK